jgi:hypothetical protein
VASAPTVCTSPSASSALCTAVLEPQYARVLAAQPSPTDESCADLGRWRSDLLTVDYGSLSSAKVVELEESRLVALEQRIEADLRLGRHDQLMDELHVLTEEHPTHENLHAQCMIAQYRSGYQSLALRTYDRLRAVLAESLGIDPTPRLRRLRRAIATHASVLATPRGMIPTARGNGVGPAGTQQHISVKDPLRAVC